MRCCLFQVDEFELEAVSLGELSHCDMRHDGDGAGEGWYCEQVVVRESDDATHEFLFPCHRYDPREGLTRSHTHVVIIIIIIIIAEISVFNVAGYLIDERRRWPVIYWTIFKINSEFLERKAHSDEKNVPIAWFD